MKSTSTDIKNGPIYISKDLKSSGQSKNKKELSTLLSKARDLLIETDNKWNHTALDKMRSMMGNDTIYRQMNIKRDLVILLVCFIILYLVALVGSTILKIPLDSFYGEVFNHFFPGR